ncbi:MAG: PadR family transcriptional regulator [Mesorhizobium sp.]|nr:PadR family transcriptional regulator [Mesorhizobium sp.]MCO5162322.1 PadR family transcriptional regulator [Mesorhizobium sp.]
MNLTTTSYAILGQLALRPWTMYDLAAQMRRNVTYFFPRAESQVYAEPKKLVELGLAEADTEATGKRARTVYRITDKGREELARWLAQPTSKGPVLEYETMLRVMLSPFGRPQDLAATLEQARDDIAGMLDTANRIRDEYLDGRAPFQRHVVHRSMMHDFLSSFADLVDEWAERSLARMARWPQQDEAERTAAAIEVIRRKPRRKPRRRD